MKEQNIEIVVSGDDLAYLEREAKRYQTDLVGVLGYMITGCRLQAEERHTESMLKRPDLQAAQRRS